MSMDRPEVLHSTPSDGGEPDPSVTPEKCSVPLLDRTDPVAMARYRAAEVAAGKAQIAMARGDKEQLLAACREGLEAAAEACDPSTPLAEVPLLKAGVSIRTANALEEHLNVTLIGDVLLYPRELLAEKVPNLGETGINSLIAALRRYASLRGERLEDADPK